MKSLKSLVVAAACLLSVSSFAALITDVERAGASTTLSFGQSVSWTHDINEYDFAFGSAESASIFIELKDDANDPWFLPFELALIKLNVFDLEDGAVVNPVVAWFGNLGISSLAKLNANGTLDVKITSIGGDFIVGSSTLKVNTVEVNDPVVSVPESSSLMMFGLGLLGLGLMRRKARA